VRGLQEGVHLGDKLADHHRYDPPGDNGAVDDNDVEHLDNVRHVRHPGTGSDDKHSHSR
jgi:hypothetical protein